MQLTRPNLIASCAFVTYIVFHLCVGSTAGSTASSESRTSKEPIYSRIKEKPSGTVSRSTKMQIQAELDAHISNEIGDSDYDLVNQKAMKRVPLLSMVMYEVEAP